MFLPAKTIFLVSDFAMLAGSMCVVLIHFYGKSLHLQTVDTVLIFLVT